MTVTLVLGGARSGKSAVAERLAGRLAGLVAGPVTYVATGVAEPDDFDMAARIATHRSRRPAAWATVESDDVAGALAAAGGTVLVDSLTTWVARAPGFRVAVEEVCRAARARSGDTVLVSDEVGLGVHPSTDAGRQFRDALGLVNQAVASVADDVLLVVAGRTLHLDRA